MTTMKLVTLNDEMYPKWQNMAVKSMEIDTGIKDVSSVRQLKKTLGSEVIKCQKTTFDGFQIVPYTISPF